MGTVGYNEQHLSEIGQSFLDKLEKVKGIHEEMNDHITVIKEKWTGDAENLAGREKDFAEIDSNLGVIEGNIGTIAKFLSEKNTDFSKINYK